MAFKFDEIGYWSEVKLEIVRSYALEYSRILSCQRLSHLYIDAFAGAGLHISKATGQMIPGSPLNALTIQPPFDEYHLVDLNAEKVALLRAATADNSGVTVYDGDCNELLLKFIFPRARYQDYRRALCLLDPYGLHLNWEVIAQAGKMGSIEIFLNFPVMDMNMNVFWHDPSKVSADQVERMNRFWGDNSWRSAAYSTEGNLFQFEEKRSNEVIAEAFGARLRKEAGFKFVPAPMPMRNTKGAIVYYLFFASPSATGDKIVRDIFDKFGNRNAPS